MPRRRCDGRVAIARLVGKAASNGMRAGTLLTGPARRHAAQTLGEVRGDAPQAVRDGAVCDRSAVMADACRVVREARGHAGDTRAMREGEERLGLLFAALCALNGAFVPAVAKLTTGLASPLLVAAASNLCAALAALLLLGLRGELRWLARRRCAWRLVAIGALGTAAAHLLFYIGASRTSAIVATLCLQIEPAYSLALAWAVLGHRPTPRRVLASLVLLAGIGLAIGASALERSLGVAVLLATPLCWQASHLVVLRGLVGVPAVVLTSARYLYGGVLLAILWLAAEGPATLPSGGEAIRLAPLLALQGCVLGYGGTLLWYLAIARLDLARTTAIVVPSIPLLSLAASFVLLGEIATPAQWAGMVLTAVGILAFVTDRRA
jgi:drug/metabolite transporter (DMT)-like permease